MARHLDWDGCFNVRDLGGLPAADGRRTRRGAIVRADALDGLSETGWTALYAHGVRTVIDLRNDGERHPDAAPRPRGVTTLRIPLDVAEDRDFWDAWRNGPQFGTPLYYGGLTDAQSDRLRERLTLVAPARRNAVGDDRVEQLAPTVSMLRD